MYEHRCALKNKGVVRILVIFKMDVRSPMRFKRSRRELSDVVGEHMSIWKNKEVVHILVILQDRPIFSHVIQKISARDFQ